VDGPALDRAAGCGPLAPEGWLETRLATLESARRPRGEAELMIIDPVRDLVCFAAGQVGATDPPRTS
jgi:hypothetical protein